MSTDHANIHTLAPAWNAREVVVFNGQKDTRIYKGGDYETRSLASLFSMEPGRAPKGEVMAFIPSTYCAYDARSHKVQRSNGSFVALCGDVDHGNHPLDRIEGLVRGFAGECAWLIYSTAHASEDDKRWRIIIPLAQPMGFEDWHDAQNAFFNFMEYGGVDMDRALERAGQPIYLPNVPDFHPRTGEILRNDDGHPIFYRRATTGTNALGITVEGALLAGMEAIARKREEDELARERVREEATRNRACRSRSADAPVMEEFNQANPIANLLELYGYEQSPRNDADWRSPHQQGDSYATRNYGDHWISLSASDAGKGLGARCAAGCFGDAYDLFVHYEHSGDHKSAFRALYQERRASQPESARRELPARHPDDPGPSAPADEMDPMGQQIEVAELPRKRGDRALPVEWVGDVEPVIDGLWLVDDWLPAHGLGALYGHPGSGKSFLALDMGLRVALGWDIAGREVEQGLVLYVVAEGQTGFRNRMVAFRDHHQIAKETPFAFVPVAIDLQAPDGDRDKLIAAISDAADVAGQRPVLVVIDTLSKTFGAGKENTDDMATYVANCSAVADRFKCCTLIVHHRPKDSESRDPRGHSSLKGGLEMIAIVEGGPIKSATTLKQKDGPDNEKISFSLKVVELGTNAKGKTVTTCIVEYRDDAPTLTSDPGKALIAKMSDRLKIVRDAIGDAIARHGVPIGDPVPDDQYNAFSVGKMVARGHAEDSIKAALQSVVSGNPDKLADNIIREKNRHVASLKSKGIVGTWEDWYWLNY